MKKITFLLLSTLFIGVYADPIKMHWLDEEEDSTTTKHFLPPHPGTFHSPLLVDQGETSILVEYDGEVTVLRARILDMDGNVIDDESTSMSSLELPLPSVGDYTIEVWVDETMYVGEFCVEE